jgi:hypothetical protein
MGQNLVRKKLKELKTILPKQQFLLKSILIMFTINKKTFKQ